MSWKVHHYSLISHVLLAFHYVFVAKKWWISGKEEKNGKRNAVDCVSGLDFRWACGGTRKGDLMSYSMGKGTEGEKVNGNIGGKKNHIGICPFHSSL